MVNLYTIVLMPFSTYMHAQQTRVHTTLYSTNIKSGSVAHEKVKIRCFLLFYCSFFLLHKIEYLLLCDMQKFAESIQFLSH